MDKIINLNRSVYELVSQCPELVDLLKELGFEGVTNPVTLKTAGRLITIPQGCQMKGIALETVKNRLKESGYDII